MSLRKLVEQEIVKGFNKGYDEVNVYSSDREIPGRVRKNFWDFTITDINLFVSSLTDEELFESLRNLHCQMYR